MTRFQSPIYRFCHVLYLDKLHDLDDFCRRSVGPGRYPPPDCEGNLPEETERVEGGHLRVRAGIEGEAWGKFKMQYYIYALVFVIFDIEAVFIYPWATAFTDIGFGGFLAMGIFILIMAESLAYLWLKGCLEWK